MPTLTTIIVVTVDTNTQGETMSYLGSAIRVRGL